jgi:tetratricopeptide (TPR) repeat protein
MKAEHRKELQTNALADRIGRFIQGMKTKTQANTILVLVIVLVVAGLGGAWWLISRSNKSARSRMWVSLDRIELPSAETTAGEFFHKDQQSERLNKIIDDLDEVIENHPGTKAAMMARFRRAQINLRSRGLDVLLDHPASALSNVQKAGREYKKLAEEYKDDRHWTAQALLGVAQVEETQALDDLKNLDKAAKLYEELADKYADTAAGKEARQRARLFKKKDTRTAIENFYKDLKEDSKLSLGR